MERTELEERVKVVARIKDRLNDYSARLLYLVISGSDLYGFASQDSDFDYRGAYVTDTSRILGLQKSKDVIEIKDGENEICLFEVRKEIGLALNSNCNVLEHLAAPPVHMTPEFLDLKEMLLTSFGKRGLYNSYRGLATFNYKKFIASGRRNSVKKYLYVFRGLMTGTYALQTSNIEPNIGKLNRYFKFKAVKELIDLKRRGKENDPLPNSLDKGQVEKVILGLFGRIDKAYHSSKLPEVPSQEDLERIEKWLIQLRKDRFQ